MQGMGINPDIIILRCDEPLEESIFNKIALFCNVPKDCVIENRTLPILYEAPLMLEESKFSEVVCRRLGIETKEPDLTEWKHMVERIKDLKSEVSIAIVGKYVALHDAYLSVAEALRHAGYWCGAKVNILWTDSETITENNYEEVLGKADGILVPGGFGNRGIEGKILAAKYARTNDVPYLGICLGMQTAVIEFARNVCGMADANSGEFDPTSKHKVIDFLPDQNDEVDKGGTLKLGAYPCKVAEDTTLYKYYGEKEIYERHRHRYEFNNEFREELIEKGIVIGGTSPDGYIVETIENDKNRFFVGVQFHPEFKSRPNKPHPLFTGLIENALRK